MKKITLTLIAFVCVICCAIGLVACHKRVTSIEVTNVTLSKSELTLTVGEEETLTATVEPDNATDKTVTWTSNNAAVATVEDGKVVGRAQGTAVISATVGNKSAECTVTVNSVALDTKAVIVEQWVQIMESATRFTIDRSVDGTLATTIKIEGAKMSQESSQVKQIFVQEGENYFLYYSPDKTSWTKSELSSSSYETYTKLYAELIKLFKDDYSAFSYSQGVYTAASLDKTAAMNSTLENVKITFENVALVGIEFDVNMGSSIHKYVIKNVGSTTVDLPINYTESNS